MYYLISSKRSQIALDESDADADQNRRRQNNPAACLVENRTVGSQATRRHCRRRVHDRPVHDRAVRVANARQREWVDGEQRIYRVAHNVEDKAQAYGGVFANQRVGHPASDEAGHVGYALEDEENERGVVGLPVEWLLVEIEQEVAKEAVVGEALEHIHRQKANEWEILLKTRAPVVDHG